MTTSDNPAAEIAALRALLAQAESDRDFMARLANRRVTPEDALTIALHKILSTAADAPNCWERDATLTAPDGSTRTARFTVQWADGKSAHEMLAETRARAEAAERERDALRAIIEGRTTPPTREEDLAHNGWWLVMVDDGRGDLMPWVSLRPSRAPTSTTRYTRFIPLRDGRPTAWPVAPEVPR